MEHEIEQATTRKVPKKKCRERSERVLTFRLRSAAVARPMDGANKSAMDGAEIGHSHLKKWCSCGATP